MIFVLLYILKYNVFFRTLDVKHVETELNLKASIFDVYNFQGRIKTK